MPPEILPVPPPEIIALLEKTAAAFRYGEVAHREQQLAAGRHAQEYLLARRALGHSRAAIVQALAGRLCEVARCPVNVNRLIATAQAADLLGAGLEHDLPLRTLREFVKLLQRDRATDAWAVKPGLEDAARSLFAQAVAERLDTAAVALEVRRILGKGDRPGPGRGDGDDGGDHGGPDRRNPLAHLAKADPRDAAEQLAQVVGRHADPEALIESLASALDWRPGLGTALAKGMLAAGAIRTANAMVLVFQQQHRQEARRQEPVRLALVGSPEGS
jgi:hypothetical protein